MVTCSLASCVGHPRFAFVSSGCLAGLRLPDRCAINGLGLDRFVFDLFRRLRRHGVVVSNDGCWSQWLLDCHFWHEQHGCHQFRLAVVVGRDFLNADFDGVCHLGWLVVCAYRRHSHHHDHLGHWGGIFLFDPTKLCALQRFSRF